MANNLPKEETVTVEEAIISQSYEIAALVSVLERKGILSREEILAEIKNMRKPEHNDSQKQRHKNRGHTRA